jgi:hypothetical protein
VRTTKPLHTTRISRNVRLFAGLLAIGLSAAVRPTNPHPDAAVILAAILDHYGLQRAAVTAATIREGMIRAYLARPKAWWK